MPESPLLIRFFLSSPGDVAVERQLAREVLDELNHDPFIKPQARIEVVAWEVGRTLMPISLTPQEAIDRELAKPSECDAVIVLFWGRMGTPLDVERHGTKANGEPYWSGTEWEFLDAVRGAAENAHRLPIVYLYRRTDTPPIPDPDDLEVMAEYVIQRQRVAAFFKQFRDPTTGAFRGMAHEYASPEGFRSLFEKDARLIVRKVLAVHQREAAGNATPAAPPVKPLVWKGSPFPGLRAFSEKDEPIFFGRGYEVADLLKRLTQQRLMFVVGASGSGKSSLVGAGLIPQLQRGGLYGVTGWQIVRFTPGDAPFWRLAFALLRILPILADPLADDEERAVQLAAVLRRGPDKLAQQVEKWLATEPEGSELLLFIDQFEELYTTTPETERVAFVALLRHVSPQIRIVTTIRADFYDKALHDFETVLRDATYTLSTPSALALYEMIVRPAQAVGLHFEEGLPETIVQHTAGQSGGLALLAYLLEALYLRAEARGDGRLTIEDYEALGGVERAIANRAEAVYQALDLPETRRQAALQRVFHELVEPTVREGEVVATRRRAPYQVFADDADACQLIEAFTQARLLVRGEGDTVEVAHEALLREWTELAQWMAVIADDLRLLRQYERDALDWHRRGAIADDQPRAEQLRGFYVALSRLERRWEDLPQPLQAYTEAEQARLLREIETPQTSHARRAEIGVRLAAIGDTRGGVGVGEDGTPEIVWCLVAPGGEIEITYGERDERQKQTFKVQPFYIARYLVTYAQFQAFVEAEDGFEDARWWAEMPAQYQQQDLEEQRSKTANHPRDSISWYQAVAFSRWLNHRLQGMVLDHPAGSDGTRWVVGENTEIRLPTEWEWQWAAQNGKEAREYPWGGWREGCANTIEAGLSRTTAVGMYPQGSAGCGVLDMSGNLWEWCLNKHDNPVQIVVDESAAARVLRGGSFYYDQGYARGVARYSNRPDRGYDLLGVRVVCAAAPLLASDL